MKCVTSWTVLWVFYFANPLGFAQPALPSSTAGGTSQTILTNAAAVRSLAPQTAAKHLPVRLQGVVTFAFNPRSFFVQDQSAGIYVGNGVEVGSLNAGDVVSLDGVTDPGDYAPLIQPTRVEVIGHTNLPAARQVSFADLMTGREDSQRVEMTGLVRGAHNDAEGEQLIDIDLGGGRVTAFVPNRPPPETQRFVDSTVRIRGVCGTWYNKLRQLFGVRLMVARWEDLSIEGIGALDVLSQPPQSIGSLLRFAPQGSYGHRVKVAGSVVLQQPGRALFIQDGQHGVYVQTQQAGKLDLGDWVEVVGFPGKGEYTPVIQDAVWKKISPGHAIAPVLVKADQALSGLYDSRLVSIEGVLLDRTHNHEQEVTLVLAADGQIFTASLPTSDNADELASLEKDSRLLLTGVCRIEVGEGWRAGPQWRAKSFRLLLRNTADVQVMSLPPWWSLKRLLWLTGILMAIVLGSLLWVSQLRLKVRKQTFIINQKLELEARLKARYRELFEKANDMVYTHDLSGRITSINVAGEQFLGRKREEVINRNLMEFIIEEQRPAARRWLEDILDGMAPAAMEWDFLAAGGNRVRVETSTRLIEHEGLEVEVEGIARDVTDRRRLEKEILEASTREQRRIGHDLHDGVCQQLAGIAVLTDILADKLDEHWRAGADEAHRITQLVNDANKQTRGVARGLFPVRLEENGLVSALEELVENSSAYYAMDCKFVCEAPVTVSDHSAALHLYFIAQEAILNAVKHGKADSIHMRLTPAGAHGCLLTVQDNGKGLSLPQPAGPGMGIRIMKYRARMLGGMLTIHSSPGQGTKVVCQLGGESESD